jgi:hypothetical protein
MGLSNTTVLSKGKKSWRLGQFCGVQNAKKKTSYFGLF